MLLHSRGVRNVSAETSLGNEASSLLRQDQLAGYRRGLRSSGKGTFQDRHHRHNATGASCRHVLGLSEGYGDGFVVAFAAEEASSSSVETR